MRPYLIILLAGLAITWRTLGAEPASATVVPAVLQRNNSPLVTFRILLRVGAANDPEGKEGLAALTAAMLSSGGSHELSYDQILAAMYPMATSFDSQVDKEMTVFTGTTHRDNLDRYYGLIRQMLLDPGFRDDDFTRLKSEAINYLAVTLRQGNDEELGKEALYNNLYHGHPYGHHNAGTVSALERLSLDDVRQFYRAQYMRSRLVIGLAGGFPEAFPDKVRQDFAKWPEGGEAKRVQAKAAVEPGLRIEIIERQTRSTAMSLGLPLDVTRGQADWAALFLANSYFGQHRSMNSHLFQRLREARGLNYGDYSYIEYFPGGGSRFQPPPNLGRQEQIFQIWIRPVEPQNALFALRAGLYEYEKLRREGLSQEAFESTREFLSKYVDVLLQTQDARLGYALDSRFYGIGAFDEYVRSSLAKLTRDEVNAALRRHLKSDRMRVVIVTKDAKGLREAILAQHPATVTYNSPKPKELLEEDQVIGKFPIPVEPSAVTIRPVAEVFQ